MASGYRCCHRVGRIQIRTISVVKPTIPHFIAGQHEAYDRNNRASAHAGGLRQGVTATIKSGLWGGGRQDCFKAVGTYLIDKSGVTLLFPTGLGGELNRFFIERVDVDADHSTLYLSRGSCRVGFTIGASISRDGAWIPLPIAPPKSRQGAEKN